MLAVYSTPFTESVAPVSSRASTALKKPGPTMTPTLPASLVPRAYMMVILVHWLSVTVSCVVAIPSTSATTFSALSVRSAASWTSISKGHVWVIQ